MKKKLLLLLTVSMFLTNYLFAQTWNGNTSTDWNTASNWAPAGVPIATGNVTIPGSLTRYPVLASNVTINSINMTAGSQLDFNGHTLDITDGVSAYNYFTGAILNNSNGGSDIVINLNTGAGGHSSYIRGTTVNDNITFNLSGTNTFNGADGSSFANAYAGNVTFNISDALAFNLSNGAASQYNGNLTIKRTIAGGTSQLFNAGGTVTGNFSFTNKLDGAVWLGNLSKPTNITGKVDIAVTHATPAGFQLRHFINQTSGGIIDVQNTKGFDVEKDTLKITSLGITGYRGADYGYFNDNDITGNITIADDASYSGGHASYVRNNHITGNADITINGANSFNEADNSNTGNHFTGDVSYTVTGTASLYISNGDTSTYGGNLTIKRPGAGYTKAFNSGAIIGGNFSFANNTAGDAIFGITSKRTSIGGKVDISINDTVPGNFGLYRLINQTAGGTIDVKNTYGFEVQNDTLKVNSLSLTGYRGTNFGRFYENDITGNIIVSDDASHPGSYYTLIRNNNITGNATFTNNGLSFFADADVANTGNHYTGNVAFNATATGGLYFSDADTSYYDGSLTVNRTGTGITQGFNHGGVVGGNFSFTNNTAGNTYFGNLSYLTTIGGKVDISLNNTITNDFQLHRITNQTTGGIINVQNTKGFNVKQDTLKLASISVTGYRGTGYGYLYDNDITGNIIVSDDASHPGSYYTLIRNNNITGNATFTNNGLSFFADADVANTGNHYTGNVAFNATATGGLYFSDADTSYYDGSLTVNRTGTGITQGFNHGGVVGGNFSFTNNTAGNTYFGNLSYLTTIGGKVDVSLNNTITNDFQLHRITNQTTGGIINVQNTKGFNVKQDTLKLASISVTGYRGTGYGYLYDNDITGNIIVSDDASHPGSYYTLIRNNNITGNATFTNNGLSFFADADIANTGNHYTGNVTFNATATGGLYFSDADTSYYDGSLTVNRTGTGITQGFNHGGVVGGDFSFTNNTAGNTYFGNLSYLTTIGGKVDVSLNNTITNDFQLHRITNQTTGGIINVQNTKGFNVKQDTLKLASISVTGYRGTGYGYLYDNDITGNIIVSDDASHPGSYYTLIRNNNITGNATFTNNGLSFFTDADAANTGNHYTGNVAFNNNNTGSFNVGTADTTSIGGGLSLNSASIVLNKIQFTDNNDGIVQQTGSMPIIIPTMIMNKGGTAKITLMDSVKVTTNLNLISGIIESGVNSNLVLPDNMTYLGGSDSSYVDGPMLKIGNEDFTFPLGQNNAYAPITITAPGNVTDQFRAQYNHMNPGDAYDSTSKDATLNHLSRLEYWLLDRTAGTSNVSVTIGWANNRSGVVNDIPSLRVTRWDGSKWKDLGHGATTGTNAMGTIQTAAAVTSFSPFTLASTNTMNPLPVTLLNFEAVKQDHNVLLSWSTANEVNFSHFEIERAGTDNQFIKIGQQDSHNSLSATQYTFSDNAPQKGINLYRLRMVDIEGKSTLSKIKAVQFTDAGKISIYPNPATNYIDISAPGKIASVEITDISGKVVKKMTHTSNNHYLINDLKKGLYIIKVFYDEQVSVSKLMVQ